VEVTCCQDRGRFDRFVRVRDLVELFVLGFEALQNEPRLLDGGLRDVDLLKTPRERAIFLEVTAVLLERRRADAAQFPRRERGLQQIGRIHASAARGAGADDRVDLVDEEHGAVELLERFDDALEALFEVAAVACAGEERSQIERVDARGLQRVRHLAEMDLPGEAFDDGGLSDAGVADEHRIVFLATRENLDDA